MPLHRRFTARNAFIVISFLFLGAYFVHIKNVIRDESAALAGTDSDLTDLTDVAELAELALPPDQLVLDSASEHEKETKQLQVNTGIKMRRTAVVVASQASENATWLDEYFPQWEKNIYRVDDPQAPLTVPKNKGRESMVYLTYIIDHYDALPDNVLFIHPNRYQWHNDDPDYDGVPMLHHFQLPYLEQEGYVNIRCVWSLGCPDEIKPLKEEGEHRASIHAGGYYKKAFQELFPDTQVPIRVGVSCCAQFAVTREKIRQKSRETYIRYREWLMNTELGDAISGRVLEYSWHMIFDKEPVHCPSAEDCYCKVFGLCNLKCNTEACEGRYMLPPFASLPQGWPLVGWNDEPRQRAGSEE
ncbi:hypothetical protein P153DRAFT_70073 [Dothidotthia symphoricarpi CBS 119687]|uniref:Uncharacterized protein n=1 Tax=Dothidotthia symphoricarpi CBS 119687 TaxID=1392245 RepID=A0A6A6A6H9_9PLEO|nr:uncharacterized protein P153DRAFT_70073 [Dothidotthia symphoricarpi CBS 119687]KAF2126795.1 hypothetical protein P153DRAFT_70073 [Dothidotthia symphoricarpi CBS 119687]